MAPRYPLAALVVLLLVGTARADLDPKLQDAVKVSIRGGQQYLQRALAGRGDAPGGGDFAGAGAVGCAHACLMGLALIESGVPPSDKLLTVLAQRCRQVALGSYSTYELSLLIMFFDRYGAKEDEPFIQFLTLRLIGGQSADGTWTYTNTALQLNPVQERSLVREFTRDGARLTTPDAPKADPEKKQPRPREDIPLDPPPPPKKAPPAPEKKEEKPDDGSGLHPSVRPFERFARTPGQGAFGPGGGDHSNTQFATVALWCGRRHRVDVSDALARLDKHFRSCQDPDGGWGYTAAGGGSSPPMTCAGLMGLAVGFGGKLRSGGTVKIDEDLLAKDRVLAAALNHLGDYLRAAAAQQPPPGRRFAANELSSNLYFMWSLERVGMAYGLTTIGKVDWYDWGCQLLIESQNPRTGSWGPDTSHVASPDVATAFALLFLSRANLAEDLTTSIKNKVKDPGQASLKSPGDLPSMLAKGSKGSLPPKAGVANPGTPEAMAEALVRAKGAERDELIRKYRDAKGSEHLDALLLAVHRLDAEAKAPVREALAERLTRMTANTINTMMTDKDAELRRAAALAAGGKGKDRRAEFAGTLIERTADDSDLVVQAARAALKALTEKDFGPEPGATADARKVAHDAWNAWWQDQK
jgi:hypothetical protein